MSRYFNDRIPLDIVLVLESCIITDEIRKSLFSILDDKDPNPNGYTCSSKEIIGRDFITTVRYFFDSSTLLRCVNATRIVLLPKIMTLTTMNDFRSIPCCNVMYKYIFKVIMNGLKGIFPVIIGPTQTAFVLGRKISNVILLT